LEKEGTIVLPAVEAKVYSAKYSKILAPERQYEIQRVEVERSLGTIIPDVLAHIGGKRLAVEVRVTHGVDEEKISRFRSLGLSVVEIDLSEAPRTLGPEQLRPLVLGGGPHKRWLYNAAAERKRQEILNSGKVLRSLYRGAALHVDGCPLKVRVWKGKPYANVVDDCVGCEHAIDIGDKTVTCGAL
jgi:hypothetical protein